MALAAAVASAPSVAAAADAVQAPSAAFVTDSAKYRLGVDDKIRIITYDESQLTGEFVVDAAGSVALPLIGNVVAKGLTVDELASAITADLKDGFIKQPSVSVEVVTFRPFYILGEVNKPGQYPFENGMTVMDAVATAGGFTYRANEKVIFVRQHGDEKEQKIRLSVGTAVQPGDTIRIAERFF
jgi:polysaccharide export outer membrane protein